MLGLLRENKMASIEGRLQMRLELAQWAIERAQGNFITNLRMEALGRDGIHAIYAAEGTNVAKLVLKGIRPALVTPKELVAGLEDAQQYLIEGEFPFGFSNDLWRYAPVRPGDSAEQVEAELGPAIQAISGLIVPALVQK